MRGNGRAGRFEQRLLWAGNPGLFALLVAGRAIGRIRRVPKLGWVVSDPVLARQILNDSDHFSMVGEGGVGDLWTQLFGSEMGQFFTGARHTEVRTLARDLFTEDNAARLVSRAQGALHAQLRAQLDAGEVVDIAYFARAVSGHTVADLLGIKIRSAHELFAAGEQLAALALGTQTSTTLDPETISRAHRLAGVITHGVEDAYRQAGPDTLLGRCREHGIGLDLARGLATLIVIAGTETGASSLSRTVALLHDTGQQHQLLADPTLITGSVREGLRVTTPAPVIGRHVARDAEIAGRRLRAGDRVLMLVYLANNGVGPFDITRGYIPETRQLWFGAGRHLCLGAAVARIQLTTLLTTLTAGGRPWRIVSRHPARKVLVPSYASLRLRSQ